MSRIIVRPIRYSDELFSDLLAIADAGDGRFVARLRDHWLDRSERFDRAGELLLGAFVAEELIGIAGVSHDPYEPKRGLGRIRHVYVLPGYRRRGIAKMLVQHVITYAGEHFDVLRLRTSNAGAARLYETFGFVRSTHGAETHRLRMPASMNGA